MMRRSAGFAARSRWRWLSTEVACDGSAASEAPAAWPLAARAQQAGKLPTIGFLVPNTRAAASEWTDAFVRRLSELGWIEGRTVAIEYRWVEGHAERFA